MKTIIRISILTFLGFLVFAAIASAQEKPKTSAEPDVLPAEMQPDILKLQMQIKDKIINLQQAKAQENADIQAINGLTEQVNATVKQDLTTLHLDPDTHHVDVDTIDQANRAVIPTFKITKAAAIPPTPPNDKDKKPPVSKKP